MAKSFREIAMDDPKVVAELDRCLAEGEKVMIAHEHRSKGDRGHKRLHRDGKGWFVRTGRRGSGKMYLVRCEVLEIEYPIFRFYRALYDFEIRARAAFEARCAEIARDYAR